MTEPGGDFVPTENDLHLEAQCHRRFVQCPKEARQNRAWQGGPKWNRTPTNGRFGEGMASSEQRVAVSSRYNYNCDCRCCCCCSYHLAVPLPPFLLAWPYQRNPGLRARWGALMCTPFATRGLPASAKGSCDGGQSCCRVLVRASLPPSPTSFVLFLADAAGKTPTWWLAARVKAVVVVGRACRIVQ